MLIELQNNDLVENTAGVCHTCDEDYPMASVFFSDDIQVHTWHIT